MAFLLLGSGLAILVFGAELLVRGAARLAASLGISALVIGLTVVAFGISAPELAVSIKSAFAGQADIAVGSNLFNLMSVLGLSSLIAPQGIDVPAAALEFDIPVMIAVSVACLPIFFAGHPTARWEGMLFLGYYLTYILYLILNAAQNGVLPLYESAMVWFAIPLTMLTLVVVTVRALAPRSNA